MQTGPQMLVYNRAILIADLPDAGTLPQEPNTGQTHEDLALVKVDGWASKYWSDLPKTDPNGEGSSFISLFSSANLYVLVIALPFL